MSGYVGLRTPNSWKQETAGLEEWEQSLKRECAGLVAGLVVFIAGISKAGIILLMLDNPEAGGKVFVPMLLGAAFAEAIAIYSLVVVFTLK